MELQAAPFYNDVADGPAGGAAYWMTAADGVQVRIGVWPVHGARGTVLLFPGRTEYIEKYGRAAADLAARGYATMAIDWRGQGLADRLIEDRASGYVDKFTDYQLDIAAMLTVADTLRMPQPRMLLAHSMGGCIGLRALMDGLPVSAAVFSAPMWGITMSTALRPAAWAMSWASRKAGFGETMAPGTKPQTYVLAEAFDGNTLTTDQDMYRYMQEQVLTYPDLSLGGPSMHWLHEALSETLELSKRPAPDTPCLTYLGSFERIVETSRIHARMQDWPGGQLEIIEGAEHEVLMDTPATRKVIFDGAVALFDAHLG